MTAATSTAPVSPANTTDHLRRLYFIRFLFAAAWAATFVGIGSSLDAASITLLILYPAFDVLAAAADVRSSRNPVLFVNMAISTVAAIGLAVAAADDLPAVLRVWGVWAIVAGLVQLFLGLNRRGLGGQWAIILSGGISVIAGASFLGQAGGATSMTLLAGYAGLGALFFLISAVRLLRLSNANKHNDSTNVQHRTF
jgi:uncharacterized membrane protein HdeD (DUF308 family)